jgi:dimethylaniline monooxygenase (N-oxide forming)
MVKLRVLIVGAGASGLPAIKCCLDEGLDPVCLERSADIGGLWNYANSLNSTDEIASVMRSTIINTCKEMMCYSDFPIPAEYPNFMHNKLVMQYLQQYADAFKLNSYIQLNTEVCIFMAVLSMFLFYKLTASLFDIQALLARLHVFMV